MKKILYATMLVLFLSGCSYSIDIKVNTFSPFQPIFYFDKPFFLKPMGNDVPLKDFSIVTEIKDKWDYKSPVWSFVIDNKAKKKIDKISYGNVPDGFTEVIKSKKLKSGVKYLAIAFGNGCRGEVEFYINESGSALDIGQNTTSH